MTTLLYKYSSFLKGYHAYQNRWDSVKREIIQSEMEPINLMDKYVVTALRGTHIVGQLKKGTNGKLAKTIFYFLKCNENNRSWVEVTGKQGNLGDGEGMQFPCMLHFILIDYKVFYRNYENVLPKF